MFIQKMKEGICQIDNVLEDKNVVLEDNITVLYEWRRGEFFEYKYKI